MKPNIREVTWFFVPLLMALLLTLSFFGIEAFTSGTIDINIHDTYFVMPTYLFYATLAIVLGFFIFIVRGAVFRFQNTWCNVSMAVYTLLFVALIVFIITTFSTMKD